MGVRALFGWGSSICWGMARATIHLTALEHNLRTLQGYVSPETQLMAAVKANAYGHGDIRVAQHLASLGVPWFGVATRDEALSLRQAGIKEDILIFTPVYQGLEALIEHEIALSVTDTQSLGVAALAAKEVGRPARVHLKVDTGMGRLGHKPEEALIIAAAADQHPNVALEAVWTHFACADEPGREFTERQLALFQAFLAELGARGIDVPLKHVANSAALIDYPESQFDLVRPGLALYGCVPGEVENLPEGALEPAMTLRAAITFVKKIRAGDSVSYGATWRAPQDTNIATVRFGYADGYPRNLGNRAEVNLNGTRCPVVGRVCMDQLMIDVGDLEPTPGDDVILFGPEGPTADELAERASTISYELLTRIGSRVTREHP